MARYKCMDGFTFEADTIQQVAEKLWRSMLDPDDTLEEWMIGSAGRAKMWNGAIIRTDTVMNHVADLMTNGFLERLE